QLDSAKLREPHGDDLGVMVANRDRRHMFIDEGQSRIGCAFPGHGIVAVLREVFARHPFVAGVTRAALCGLRNHGPSGGTTSDGIKSLACVWTASPSTSTTTRSSYDPSRSRTSFPT